MYCTAQRQKEHELLLRTPAQHANVNDDLVAQWVILSILVRLTGRAC